MKIILSIAGSDPSGGAGIQADIKTITSIGCFAGAIPTAITCQNSLGVSLVSPLEPSLIHNQITHVLSDAEVSHIKIGMTATSAIVKTIAKSLRGFSGEIIVDPVLKSSSGTSLQDDTPLVLSPLIAIASVLTPNILELATLSELACDTRAMTLKAGEKILHSFPNLQAICLKGGHLNEQDHTVEDILLFKEEDKLKEKAVFHPRYTTRNSHGTGCTFASAFTAFHAQYDNYEIAFVKTVDYVDTLLDKGQNDRLGAGNGPLVHYRQNRCAKAD